MIKIELKFDNFKLGTKLAIHARYCTNKSIKREVNLVDRINWGLQIHQLSTLIIKSAFLINDFSYYNILAAFYNSLNFTHEKSHAAFYF